MSASVFAQISSNFTGNADGWTTPNDADGTITYNAAGGNPTGHVSATPFFIVTGSGNIYLYFYFIAPGKFLGNRSGYYNGTLRYDIQLSSTGTSTQYAEVVITDNTGVALYYFPTTPFQPAAVPTWTTFSVNLGAGSGFWKTTNSPTGPAATEAQIRAILTDLASLEIRGLYRDANTTNRLDNVTFMPPMDVTAQPTPSTVCAGATATFATAATGNANITYQWERQTGPTAWVNVTNTGGYSGAATNTLSVNTTGNFGAGTYRCRISGTAVDDQYSSSASLTVNALPGAPSVTGNASCAAGSLPLSASGGAAGQYRWYTVAVGGTAIAGQTNATYSTPVLAATTTYYVAINNGTCQSSRTAVTATINTPPAAPATTGQTICTGATASLSASGGAAGQYRWYTAPTGGTFIAGQTNSSYNTQVLSATTTYYVAINNGICEGARAPVTATVVASASAPSATDGSSCTAGPVTLTASGGTAGQYRWYSVPSSGTPIAGETGSTYTTPSLSATTTYYVSIHNGTCESARTPVVAKIEPPECNNHPPVIATAPLSTQIDGIITVGLDDLISDSDDNVDLSTLTIVSQPSSGAVATIDQNFNLSIDYKGIAFSGTEHISLRVCDIFSVCAEQIFSIEVFGEIVIYNAISPNNDSSNPVFMIEHIEKLPDTRENRVKIFNRWGDVVWEGSNYNNTTVAFTGKSDSDADLPSGTYFYRIEFLSQRPSQTGYLSLKR